MAVRGLPNPLQIGAGIAVAGGLAGILEPGLRVVAYGANAIAPTVMPPVGDAVNLFIRGRIDRDAMQTILLANGASVERKGKAVPYRAWQQVVDGAYTRLDLDDIWRLLIRGSLDGQQALSAIRDLGYRDGEVTAAVRLLLEEPAGPAEAVRYWRRGYFGRDVAAKMMQESAHMSADRANHFIDSSNYVPAPQDLVRWMVRDVEDKAIVGPENLDTAFGAKFAGLIREFAKWQGVDEETMLRYWRAHWVFPSQGQVYETFHRLREDNKEEYQALVPGAKPVSLDDVKRVLAINDLAPNWQDRLAAVAYKPPTRRDLRIMIKWDRITLQETISYVRNFGYSPADAEKVATAIYLDARPDKQESIVREGKAAIRKAFNLGAIGEPDVRFLAREYGLYDNEVDRFVVGLRLADSVEMLSAAVKATKVIFLNGNYDRVQAQGNLVAAGVLPDRARRFVDLWALELLKGRRVISEGRARTQYVEGVITLADYAQVVRNLGFSDIDGDRLVREAELKRGEYVSAAIKRQIDEARTAANRAREALARSGSRSQVLKWLKDGLIDPAAAEQRLLALGTDPADIERYFNDLGTSYHGKPVPPPRPKPAGGKPGKPPGTPGSHVTLRGGKVPAAGTACKWFRDGVISEEKFREYLKEIGYEGEEQDSYVRDCVAKPGSPNPGATAPPPQAGPPPGQSGGGQPAPPPGGVHH